MSRVPLLLGRALWSWLAAFLRLLGFGVGVKRRTAIGNPHYHLWQVIEERRESRPDRPHAWDFEQCEARRRSRGRMPRWRRAARGRLLIPVAPVLALAFAAAGAFAYFTASSTGSAQASVGSLAAPTGVSATASGSTVTMSWSQVSAPAGGAVDGYYVSRDGSAVGGSCGSPSSLIATAGCSDTGVSAGSHSYQVTAVWRSWTSTGAGSAVLVLNAPSLTAKPASLSANATPTFSFAEGDATGFACSLDGGSFGSCPSPFTAPALTDGPHSFAVHGTNGTSVSQNSTYTWTINTVAPTITASPSNPSANGSPSFSFTDASYSSFKCRLDAAASFTACASPVLLGALADGSHTFRVEAIDGDGAATTFASSTWTIDSSAPTIVTKPQSPSANSSPAFAFTEPGFGSFVCQLDASGSYTAAQCSPSALSNASHILDVKGAALDGSLTTKASYAWTVDATAPTLAATPSNPSANAAPSLSFTQTSYSSFKCNLDGSGFSACSSPDPTGALSDGSHTFKVEATDSDGASTQIASYTWTVNTAAPSFTTRPSNPSAAPAPAFAFSDTGYSTFVCQIGGTGSFTAANCTPSSLSNAPHTLAVKAQATDGSLTAAGIYTWTVNAAAPAFSTEPSNPSAATAPAFSFADTGYSTFLCQIDGTGSFTSGNCAPGSLSNAPHTLAVKAQANDGSITAAGSYTWTVNTAAPSFTTKPSNPSAATAPTFSFADTGYSTFVCQLDGAGAFTVGNCSPVALSNASHTLVAKAQAGDGSLTASASLAWTVDSSTPTITAKPSNPSAATGPSFNFSHAQASYTFICQLDGLGYSSCTSGKTYAGLADGSHTFQVLAVSGDSAVTTAASYAWTVNTAAPSFTSKPSSPSAATAPSFSFADTGYSAFVCQLEGTGAFTAGNCSPSGLPSGSHALVVKAQAGDGSFTASASYTWTINTGAPALTSNPPSSTIATSATFGFAQAAYSTFKCSLDGAAYTTCSSPTTYTGLSVANHTFQVEAIDSDGVATSASNLFSWTVNAPGAETALASGPWNNVDTWMADSETGTITTAKNSSTITGVGTSFTTQIAVGDRILENDGTTSIGLVQSITDNTHLILTAHASVGVSGATFTDRSIPVVTDNVSILGAFTVTIPTGYTAVANTMMIGNASDGNAQTLSFTGSTSILSVTGDVTLNQPNANATRTISVGAGTMNVGGNLNLSAGAASNNAGRVDSVTISTGTVTVSGNLVFNSGNFSSPAAVNSQVGFSGAGTLNLAGAFTIKGGSGTPAGTLTPSSGTVNFNGTVAQTIPIGVSSVVYPNLEINNTSASGASLSAAITNTNVTGSLRVQSGLLDNGGFAIAAGAGDTFQVAANATLRLSGTTSAFPTGYATYNLDPASTVNYAGSGAQTVASATSYGNLIVSGGSAKTAAAALTVNGALSIASGTTFNASTFGHTLGGDFTNNGTFTAGTSTFTFNGSTQQTLSGSGLTFNAVTVSNSAGILLNGSDLTVGSTLTLTAGQITTGSNKVVAGGAVSRTSGYVDGNLQESVAGGASSPTFPVGTSSAYAPIGLSITGASPGGNLTASSTAGQEANYSTSGVSSTQYVNRYWTLTAGGGLTVTGYNATFTFVSGDLVGVPNTSKLVVREYSGGGWSAPASSSSTSTSATGTGLGTTFGDYVAGISTATPVISFVQQNSITPAAGASSVAPTLSSGVTAGDALILVIADEAGGGATVSSVSGGGVTWTKAVATSSVTNGDAEIWYGLNSTGTTGSTAITVNLSHNTNVQIADVSEWSGVSTVGALDPSTNSNNGSSTSITAGPITPSMNGELVISDGYTGYTGSLDNPNPPTPSAGFTALVENSGLSGYYRGLGAYLVQGTAGSISTTWTVGSASWAAAIAAFEP
jgi:hypothetical protein